MTAERNVLEYTTAERYVEQIVERLKELEKKILDFPEEYWMFDVNALMTDIIQLMSKVDTVTVHIEDIIKQLKELDRKDAETIKKSFKGEVDE